MIVYAVIRGDDRDGFLCGISRSVDGAAEVAREDAAEDVELLSYHGPFDLSGGYDWHCIAVSRDPDEERAKSHEYHIVLMPMEVDG